VLTMELDETFMREALRLAVKARAAEEVPVGAVVVREGKIISRAYIKSSCSKTQPPTRKC